ncbi:hypothetical protein AYW79_13545 [Ferroacidibacillus organovorans]|uniref:Uncharacterized protein n=1 Tax=Ferroacidibacillus organovorans TaxID=1765683 RepID=A0A162SDH5_9BACL|nr:hypothetical protein AYJ22_13935 [Ferroacidibacillus organovorans]OAG91662.1 hypothetical protein AYW79_13545 [Ferroacidibacillus organovorans]OPG16695.1 hypothetical protein B2M26_04860 [Ferroacidibacillus organovorans]
MSTCDDTTERNAWTGKTIAWTGRSTGVQSHGEAGTQKRRDREIETTQSQGVLFTQNYPFPSFQLLFLVVNTEEEPD